MLAQCTALVHLKLGGNQISDDGARRFAAVLTQCRALAHLDLSCNRISDNGGRRLAGALRKCRTLTHLNLGGNVIDADAAEGLRLRASWSSQASGLLL